MHLKFSIIVIKAVGITAFMALVLIATYYQDI
ncbi:inhibitor of alpha-polymerase [Pseudomonas phage D3]|uniref:Inhibitor of alpha-polymerase n=2 Tax=Detrevirus TaxID=1623287 RepID=D4FUM7_BPD3|nr:inhibitor of alpha-polymerase [Pseudomonas phage PMG1]YP_009173780.1 inhibitor of alpha-polymerase [Pseudomonas phage D3]ADE05840.1 inhibitor of alpha-polymerase [Pseudomonas phage D3]AEX55898.1 inhibitor of alpha-polymerase [Pseudomonas phage PMG1]